MPAANRSIRQTRLTAGGAQVEVYDASLFETDSWRCTGCAATGQADDLETATLFATSHAQRCRTQQQPTPRKATR
jgi:hypothetical protein